MCDLHARIHETRQKIGAALLELRMVKERGQRIVHRMNEAYEELAALLDQSADDAKMLPNQR
jgi:hypothetical protein